MVLTGLLLFDTYLGRNVANLSRLSFLEQNVRAKRSEQGRESFAIDAEEVILWVSGLNYS